MDMREPSIHFYGEYFRGRDLAFRVASKIGWSSVNASGNYYRTVR